MNPITDHSTPTPINVVLIEDHEDFMTSMVFILNASEDVRAIGFTSCKEAFVHMGLHVPDIVIMDINMPDMDGIEGTRKIKERWPQVHVMICTVHEDDRMIFSALRAGAAGYLLKRSPMAEVHASLHVIQSGGSPMSPAIARRVVSSFREVSRVDDPNALTAREQGVLDLISTGLRDKEIAEQLHITLNTVRTHIRHIYEKLQVQGRVEAVNKARRSQH